MVCFHQSEWGVEFSHLKSEIDTFLDKGINKEEDEGIKNILIERKNEALQITEAKVNALSFWKEVKVSGNSMPEGVTYEPHTNSCRKMHSWETEPILQPGESPSTLEQFPTNNKVYHFHPNMFVRQMKRLEDEKAPWMKIAYGELGIEEIEGSKHNERVLEYHKSAGLKDHNNKRGTLIKITDDKAWPWCSSFVCWVFTQTISYTGKITAKATNWQNWGKAENKDKPMYGAIAVIDWGKNDNKAGHVGFIVKVDEEHIYLLGGNQTGGDKKTKGKVCIGRYKKSFIDYVRIPENYKPTKNDYTYDEIEISESGFESLASTR